jgi:hypothetical protein
VAQGDCLGERHVEPTGPGHCGGDLGHLERVGQPGALVILREDEHLGLPGQAAERGGMEDPVAVTFEAGAPFVGFLGSVPVPAAHRPAGTRGEEAVFTPLTRLAPKGLRRATRNANAGSVTSAVAITKAIAHVFGGTSSRARLVDSGPGIDMGQADRARIPRHRRSPTLVATRLSGGVDTTHVVQSAASL